MTQPFMRAYTELLVRTCHDRGTFAMGGMAALIPSTLNAQSTADRPPSVLQELAESAKSLFDAVYASDWRSASEQMQALSNAASVLPLDLPKPDIVSRLKAAVTAFKDVATDKVEQTIIEFH